jgi:hypothetical protein
MLKVLPVAGDVCPRRLWLCGSQEDNHRYTTYYDVDKIDE